MIVGLGLDVVSVPRIAAMLQRRGEGIPRRVLTAAELAAMPGPRLAEWLSGRIAAKEAASKALGAPAGIHWRCVEVVSARPGPPTLRLFDIARARADALGVTCAHLTITHDGGIAAAVVVLEADA